MLIAAQILGVTAVGLFLLSYQLKRRSQIVWVSFFSNLFYVIQYVLLGAFSGVVMDLLCTAASFLATKKYQPFVKKHTKWFVAATVLVIMAIGIAITISSHSLMELLPAFGAAFQSAGLWCDNEQTIRKLGLCGAPCWLVYNIVAQAYGAAIGSLFIIISIIVSLVRYGKKKA